MRIAVVSDIHGNLLALEAVLTDLRGAAPDAIVNCGDHVSGPLQAAETADLLMSLSSGWTHIRGNHDRGIAETAPAAMGLSDAAAAAQLRPGHFAWLRAMPSSAQMEDLLLVHGTPASDLEYLLETVHCPYLCLSGRDEIEQRLQGVTSSFVCCGHSHIPRCISAAACTLVNPGSVGLPAYNDADHFSETGSPHARYALLDRSGGDWSVTFRAVTYDNETAADLAARAGRRDWEHALRTGFALRSV